MLRMGFAETDITPSKSCETVGFGRHDNMSKGVLHPFLAQAVVWQSEKEKCCLIAVNSKWAKRAAAAGDTACNRSCECTVGR